MKLSLRLFFCLLLIGFVRCKSDIPTKIDLSGVWQFAMDPADEGIKARWYDKSLNDQIILPGSMTSNGKGYNVTLKTKWTGQIVDSSFFKNPEYAPYRDSVNFKVPFWLQPVKHYTGAAWYRREVNIPSGWKGQHITLFLERCHWESRLWADGKEVGIQNSLGTPHQYDLSAILTPGKHTLTICIDNRIKEIDPGVNSHSVSDHTQTNWNGVVGKIFLQAQPVVSVRNLQIFPDIHKYLISVRIKINNLSSEIQKSVLVISVENTGKQSVSRVVLPPGERDLSMDIYLGEPVALWSEFHPNLYKLTAVIQPDTSPADTFRTTFGMREIRTEGKQLLINDKPLFLRGTLECAIFPKTGYPPTEISEWLRIFKICKAHGLNHMRFHSWCPPEAAFEAADQAGFYLHVECSSWANQSTTLGDGKPIDRYIYDESERMVEAYGNHPSFCMMAYGNEPGGHHQVSWLTEFVTFWKNKDNRRIYTSGAGWPNLEVNDYLSTSNPRIQGWGEELKSVINRLPPSTSYDWSERIAAFHQPVVSHEIGQWCVYPNFKEIVRYDGVVRAKNFEIFRETLRKNGLEQLADSFLLASGKLQALCYKADIEAALRTKGFSGFQLLDLHDFPGQGTALVGVLDPFWEEKGYVTPAEYSRFCNSTVPLARMKKLIFSNDESFQALAEVAHFGDYPLSAITPEWKVTHQSGLTFKEGKLGVMDIPLGNGTLLGNISFPLMELKSPQKLTLTLNVGTFSNNWDFWVYPTKTKPVSGADEIRITQLPDEKTLQFLQEGGIVLLNLKKGTLAPDMGGNIKTGFSSIFWNTAWTHGQGPHTLGILCNPAHPALADFPTEFHSNWPWWDAMSHSGSIILSGFPKEIKPIVRVIDDWFTNRPLALLFEAKVGKGKLLVSGIDLQSDLANRPEAQQLLYSLEKYMAGSRFNPEVEVAPDKIRLLVISGLNPKN
jgi:hypothetical protein